MNCNQRGSHLVCCMDLSLRSRYVGKRYGYCGVDRPSLPCKYIYQAPELRALPISLRPLSPADSDTSFVPGIMKFVSLFSAALVTCSSPFVAALGLKHEHPGDLFKMIHHGNHQWPSKGVINNGTPTGETRSINGGMFCQNSVAQVDNEIDNRKKPITLHIHRIRRRISRFCI